jgi:hypothetical protein
MGLCLVCVREFWKRLFDAMHGDGVWGWLGEGIGIRLHHVYSVVAICLAGGLQLAAA